MVYISLFHQDTKCQVIRAGALMSSLDPSQNLLTLSILGGEQDNPEDVSVNKLRGECKEEYKLSL